MSGTKTIFALAMVLGLVLYTAPALAMNVNIDAAAAKAVLMVLKNPGLSREEALVIAHLPGNRGLVDKEIGYSRPAREEDFADALLAAARDQPEDPTHRFRLDRVKQKASDLQSLITQIEADPVAFNQWIFDRVNQYSPTSVNETINGYLVVGGTSGGFAFGNPEFFLNLSYFDEFEWAKIVMAHELYHAVQGVLAPKPSQWWNDKEKIAKAPPNRRATASFCQSAADLFQALYDEGTASLVGDLHLLPQTAGPKAMKAVQEFDGGLELKRRAILLELSLIGLTVRDPVPYDDVYRLGFYVPELLYKLGFVMAQAIESDIGKDQLAATLSQPGYWFVAQYLALPKYGQDEAHPKLGRHTEDWSKRLAKNCLPNS